MAYKSANGRRPFERASKDMHSHIINDETVSEFLKSCKLPPIVEQETVAKEEGEFQEPKNNPINYVFSFDGGYTETKVREDFPSSNIAFFQFGALFFEMADLENVTFEKFISPATIQKLKEIERFKLPLPTKNIVYQGCTTLSDSFRAVLHDFFCRDRDGVKLNDVLRWLMYEEYRGAGATSEWTLSQCPYNTCDGKDVVMKRCDVLNDGTCICPHCGGRLYLIDAFRLHEIVDDELGAGGVLGFLTVALEQILMIAVIRLLYENAPDMLKETIFIKDGPLAFFGQTANFQKPTRKFLNFLRDTGFTPYVVGLEKTGAFVDHALQIKDKMKPGSYIILSNDYIYKHIIPTNAPNPATYGSSTYYGNKIIFKNPFGDILVATLPTKQAMDNPGKTDFEGLDVILANLTRLKCDSFDSALIPIAITNKLVSLSHRPSAQILNKFAKSKIDHK